MNEAIRRQAQIGLYLIEDAILELLYITRLNDPAVWLNSTDLHSALGLSGHPDWHYKFTQIILTALHETKRVERDGHKHKPIWRIANVEFRKRQIA